VSVEPGPGCLESPGIASELTHWISLNFLPDLPILKLPALAGRRTRMALISWNGKYSVGVQSMDSQHNVLFAILNDLHDAMMKGHAHGITGALLRKLAKYAHEHFTAEEAMMSAATYPGLAEHRVKHRDLTRQVDEFVVRYERGETTLNLHLLNFLRDWLTNHIEKVDHGYGSWMNKHGVH